MLSASALSHEGTLYLFYSAASILEPKVERIGLAVLEKNQTTWKRLPLRWLTVFGSSQCFAEREVGWGGGSRLNSMHPDTPQGHQGG